MLICLAYYMVHKSWHIFVNKVPFTLLYFKQVGKQNYDVLITLGFILQARTAREDKKPQLMVTEVVFLKLPS